MEETEGIGRNTNIQILPQSQKEIIDSLLTLDTLEDDENFKKTFWVFLDRSSALTFYKDEDESRLLNMFEIIKSYYLAGLPFGKHTPELEMKFQQVKLLFRNRIKMSIGQIGSMKITNRSLLTTSMTQSIVQKPEETEQFGVRRKGFLARIIK